MNTERDPIHEATETDALEKIESETLSNIVIIGTPEQQVTVRKIIAESFTVKEQKALVQKGKMVIYVKELPSNIAAVYDGKSDGVNYRLAIDPSLIDDGDSLLHELVHHSRMVDDSRDCIILRSRSKSAAVIEIDPDDRALEEAATILETLARQHGYVEPIVSGYHGDESVSRGRDPFVLIRRDRELVTGSAEPGSKGLKGTRAKKAVKEKFRDSEIKDYVMIKRSPKSAKDRLDELERESE